MKFLRMPNRAQSLKQASSMLPNENQQNIDPSECIKPFQKCLTTASTMEAEEIEQPKKQLKQEEVYQKQILEFLLSTTRKSPQQYNYFSKQPDITQHMRMVLINWLIDVHLKYKLNPQTLFITINIIDTYLSAQVVFRNQLQLVGITSLWIAAKYQETYQVPKISNLVYICDSTYTGQHILEMESKILSEIKFDFLKTTSLSYYQTLTRYTFLKQKDLFLGKYLLESMMFDVSTRKYTQLTIAASVIFFIQKLRGYQLTKEQKISEISKVNDKQLRTCARQICFMWQKINQINQMSSLKQKFLRPQFLEVAKIRISQKNQKASK